MRDLTSKLNKLTINDGRSGTVLTLFYRNPTTEEEVAYINTLFHRRGNKLIINVGDVRVDLGLKIIQGFKDGDFGVDGKPISSNPESPEYCPDWKKYLKENAADILNIFAAAIFENTRVMSAESDTGNLELAMKEEDNQQIIPL